MGVPAKSLEQKAALYFKRGGLQSLLPKGLFNSGIPPRLVTTTPQRTRKRYAMRFLISNDDGYFSLGIAALAEVLQAHGEVVVVAPERDRSGASNALTLDRPLRVRQTQNGFISVNGTPTDCVYLALTGLLEAPPDMVFSGINHGANLGYDTHYSGTVAAATEAYQLGVPAVAVSLVGRQAQHFATAQAVVDTLVTRFKAQPFAAPLLLNVNVPDVPLSDLAGLEVTRLGRRYPAQPVICSQNPRGETVYWAGGVGEVQDADEGTDFNAIHCRRASLTPLHLDMTAHPQIALLTAWLTA